MDSSEIQDVAPGRRYHLPADAVIFDVGANFGSVCLPLAAALPASKVYAFEPTDYAFAKLTRNLELNPSLRSRVHALQTFVSSQSGQNVDQAAFSSWRVDTFKQLEPSHPILGGIRKSATARQISLDDFIVSERIDRLDFIKIDTDGHELEVLQGAFDALLRFKPIVVFELMTYMMQERELKFQDYEAILGPVGYRLQDARTGREVNRQTLGRIVPRYGGIDVLAMPVREK